MPGAFITNDLKILFASSDFGEAAGDITWKGRPISGIFDAADTEVTTGDGETVILAQPMITVASASVPGIAEGDVVVVRGTGYVVSHWMDDGTGLIEIYLGDAL